MDTWRSELQDGITLSGRRCGTDVDEFEKYFRFRADLTQKGVDTRIALDLVRLGERAAYDAGVLLSGDPDLAEAVRTAQDAGRRIVVAYPEGREASVATELRQLADELLPIPVAALDTIIRVRTDSSPRAASGSEDNYAPE